MQPFCNVGDNVNQDSIGNRCSRMIVTCFEVTTPQSPEPLNTHMLVIPSCDHNLKGGTDL